MRKDVRARSIIRKIQAVGFVGVTFLSFFPRFFHYQEYLFFGLLALAIYLAWQDRASVSLQSPIDVPLLGFVGWVLLTVPFAIDPGYSFSEWRKFVVQPLTFYWALFVFRHFRGGVLLEGVLWAMVLGSLTLSSFALTDFVSRGGTWRDRVIRAEAPSSDYNWLASYLVLVIPVLIAWLAGQRRWTTRAMGLLTVLLAVFAQIAAYTRAGWIAHFTQVLGAVWIVRRQRLIIWVLIGTIAIGSTLFAVSRTGYQRETMDPWTFSARVKTWQLGLQQVLQHPIVGVGYGNNTFAKLYQANIEADKGTRPEEKLLTGLHNTFAMVLMGSGIPALVLFISIMVRVIQKLLSGIRELSLWHAGMLWLPPAIALSVFGFVVRNAFDYMFTGSLASLFWILVAMGFSIEGNDAKSLDLLNSSQPRGL